MSRPLTAPALARAVVTMTEAKSAALARLAMPSGASRDLATGHRHRPVLLAAPLEAAGGAAAADLDQPAHEARRDHRRRRPRRDARGAALAERPRGRATRAASCHALGRYGVTRSGAVRRPSRRTSTPTALELLRRNQRPCSCEPLVDGRRLRDGRRDRSRALRHAAGQRRRRRAGPAGGHAGGQPGRGAVAMERVPRPAPPGRARRRRRDAGRGDAEALDPLPLVAAALALGWREKWPAP